MTFSPLSTRNADIDLCPPPEVEGGDTRCETVIGSITILVDGRFDDSSEDATVAMPPTNATAIEMMSYKVLHDAFRNTPLISAVAPDLAVGATFFWPLSGRDIPPAARQTRPYPHAASAYVGGDSDRGVAAAATERLTSPISANVVASVGIASAAILLLALLGLYRQNGMAGKSSPQRWADRRRRQQQPPPVLGIIGNANYGAHSIFDDNDDNDEEETSATSHEIKINFPVKIGCGASDESSVQSDLSMECSSVGSLVNTSLCSIGRITLERIDEGSTLR